MTALVLTEYIDVPFLQHLLEMTWRISGIPCRIFPPPNRGNRQAYIQVPQEDEIPHLQPCSLPPEVISTLEGEYRTAETLRFYCLPIELEGECLGVLALGCYSLPGDLPARSASAITMERRNAGIENYRLLVNFVTATLHRNLINQKTQRALAELEGRYQSIFGSIEEGILVESPDGSILDANPAVAAMHGYTRDEILLLKVQDLLPSDRPILISVDHPPSGPIESYDRRKDGTIFPVELNGKVWEFEGRYYLLVVVRDITARRQAEEEGRQNKERLELALEAAEAGLWDWNSVAGQIYMSPRWFTMLGYQLGELPFALETWQALLHPDDLVQANQIFEEHIAGKSRAYISEFRLHGKDGSWHWILSRGKITRRDAQGNPIRMTGVHIDITQRKQSEAALRASEEKFYKAFQISPDAICIIRAADMTFLEVNDNFLTTCGFTREEILGKSTTEVNIWAYAEDRENLERQMLEKGEVLGLEAQFRHRTGRTGVGMVAARMIDIIGTPCILAIIRDITDRKQAEELLRDAHVRLKWAYEATLMGWNKALEMRDVATRRHSDRCTELTLRLAATAGIQDNERLTFINYGAILHDIGKLAIPDFILNKPAALSSEEWGIMRRHPLYAQEMLQGIDYLHPALPLITNHHERWNGKGYPLGLVAEEIPLEARIFAIVDVWDSMTTPRPYRPALSEEAALNFIRQNAGQLFDPDLVPLFLEMVAKS